MHHHFDGKPALAARRSPLAAVRRNAERLRAAAEADPNGEGSATGRTCGANAACRAAAASAASPRTRRASSAPRCAAPWRRPPTGRAAGSPPYSKRAATAAAIGAVVQGGYVLAHTAA
ncbi:MAG TPA: hypothetical protein VE546_01585 [Streptomyces sp.]|uniref:hypothetical protein n=1 Tax=Streptomyces sp. TaxID=1931 RepID=UPI002D30C9CB|nr:hypothetical protein [Streptomyces sp.]HZG02263.1 hypothetical protein [Streptomyces sp.]